jgi:hypothetical protein
MGIKARLYAEKEALKQDRLEKRAVINQEAHQKIVQVRSNYDTQIKKLEDKRAVELATIDETCAGSLKKLDDVYVEKKLEADMKIKQERNWLSANFPQILEYILNQMEQKDNEKWVAGQYLEPTIEEGDTFSFELGQLYTLNRRPVAFFIKKEKQKSFSGVILNVDEKVNKFRKSIDHFDFLESEIPKGLTEELLKAKESLCNNVDLYVFKCVTGDFELDWLVIADEIANIYGLNKAVEEFIDDLKAKQKEETAEMQKQLSDK